MLIVVLIIGIALGVGLTIAFYADEEERCRWRAQNTQVEGLRKTARIEGLVTDAFLRMQDEVNRARRRS
jgi:hypothetical protein